MIRCPFEPAGAPVEGELQGIAKNEQLGFEEATYQCPNGHAWTKPTLRYLVRSGAYDRRWEEQAARRDP